MSSPTDRPLETSTDIENSRKNLLDKFGKLFDILRSYDESDNDYRKRLIKRFNK